MRHADIEHVRPLRQHRIVRRNGRLLRRVLHQREIDRRRQHLLWRGEVARIAGVEGGSLERFPGQTDARAQLVGADVLLHLVEAQPCIQRPLAVDLPFVLQIGAEQVTGLGAGIEHGERRIEGVADAVERQKGRGIVDQRIFRAGRESKAERVSIADAPGRIFLNAVDDAAAIDVGGDAIEDEIADRIRREMQRARAVEIGNLVVDAVGGFLIGEHVELIEFVLPLVEFRRIEIGDAVGRKGRSLPGIVRNLVAAVRDPAHESQAAGRIEHGREIQEAFFLVGMIVNRAPGRRRIFQSKVAAEVSAGDEILGLADRAAILDARRDGAVATAVNTGAAAVVEGVGFGLDIDHAGGAQSILRRQRARNQRHVADQRGVDDLAEAADAVGQHDAVDAVLQVGMLVADVEIAAGGGILRHARNLQQHLVPGGVSALRQGLDRLLAHRIRHGTCRRCDARPCVVESGVLRGQHLSFARRRRGIGLLPAVLGDDMGLGATWLLRTPRRRHLDFRQHGGGAGVRRILGDGGSADAEREQRDRARQQKITSKRKRHNLILRSRSYAGSRGIRAVALP